MPDTISFLHLSDIHFTKGTSNVSSFDIDRIVRNELVRDAANLLPAVQPLTGIIVSGDIAFAGKPDEFKTGIDWLAELSAKLNCDPSLVWCVPGNHDVDRNVIREHTGITPIQNEIRVSTDLNACMKRHLTAAMLQCFSSLSEPITTALVKDLNVHQFQQSRGGNSILASMTDQHLGYEV
ncbi:metallophosphoesterase family protein [Acidisarcina polymorpha]|uniref:metallophosphoesterase family protein n=1 Tax=Acidisarcina polymorpha TaxID=2211140 RepID=UPI000DEF8CE7|nr:metallophosphoesterase [Acidisarcina polymorpha]